MITMDNDMDYQDSIVSKSISNQFSWPINYTLSWPISNTIFSGSIDIPQGSPFRQRRHQEQMLRLQEECRELKAWAMRGDRVPGLVHRDSPFLD